jgi:hypothetical protein
MSLSVPAHLPEIESETIIWNRNKTFVTGIQFRNKQGDDLLDVYFSVDGSRLQSQSCLNISLSFPWHQS